MNEPTIAMMFGGISIFVIFAAMFIWGLKTGQFKNIEEAKYRMFEIDNTGNMDYTKNKNRKSKNVKNENVKNENTENRDTKNEESKKNKKVEVNKDA